MGAYYKIWAAQGVYFFNDKGAAYYGAQNITLQIYYTLSSLGLKNGIIYKDSTVKHWWKTNHLLRRTEEAKAKLKLTEIESMKSDKN